MKNTQNTQNLPESLNSKDLKTNHDIQSAIRFLENLYTEIKLSNHIDDLRDPNILAKFQESIQTLKKNL